MAASARQRKKTDDVVAEPPKEEDTAILVWRFACVKIVLNVKTFGQAGSQGSRASRTFCKGHHAIVAQNLTAAAAATVATHTQFITHNPAANTNTGTRTHTQTHRLCEYGTRACDAVIILVFIKPKARDLLRCCASRAMPRLRYGKQIDINFFLHI